MITRRHLMKDAVVSIVVKPLPGHIHHARRETRFRADNLP